MHQDAAEEIPADAVPAIQDLSHHLFEERHPGEAAEGEVEARVQVRPLVEPVRRHRAIHLLDDLAEQFHLIGVRARGRLPRRDDFQPFEHGKDFQDRVARDRRDRRADVRHVHDQTFRLEDLERLANGDRADLEPPGQVVDDEPLAGLQSRTG